MSPDAIADQVFDAIRDERFYILTHPDTELEVEMRMQNILQRRKPALGFHQQLNEAGHIV